MTCAERGFTLVETIVTVGIVAVLLAAGGVWLLGMHPAALTQAADDYDAALAAARGLAATSGNGATLAFLPRAGVPGFTLRAYAGRPVSANAVQPSTAMPVVSDATVAEATLGKPPFAIFIGASGHASGKASYPSVDANGNASFTAIAIEPACPAGGFVLTFTSPQGATMQRTLPCTVAATGGQGLPNPSPTPNVPLVTPDSLVYHWPADAEQTFVATEWGYTHWFASTTGFACGDNVATYPDVLPKPYSAPYTKVEGDATPAPPANEPFSYPNSGGASMNDAPATFRLDPSTAGLCTPTVRDDYGQTARGNAQVMGWLTASYGGKEYTHLSSPTLALPASVLPKQGSTVTLPLSKIYDAQALQPMVALDAACSPYVSVATATGTTPATPSAKAATASITLTLVNLPKSPVSCGGVIYDQYPGSQTGEGITFNADIETEGPMTGFPPAQEIALTGNLGLDAAQTKPCYAIALASPGGAVLANQKAQADAGGTVRLQTDALGCILDGSGTPIVGGAAVGYESGFTGQFLGSPDSCSGVLGLDSWSPNSNGPGGDRVVLTPTALGSCAFSLHGDPQSATPTATLAAQVVQSVCTYSTGGVIYGIGGSCTFVPGPMPASGASCVPATKGEPGTGSYSDGFSGTMEIVITSGNATVDQKTQVVTRTGPGQITLDQDDSYLTYNPTTCAASVEFKPIYTVNID